MPDLSRKTFFNHFCSRFWSGISFTENHDIKFRKRAPKFSHQPTRNKSSLPCPSKTSQSAIVFNTIWPYFMYVLRYCPNLVWLLFGVYPHSQSPQFETGRDKWITVTPDDVKSNNHSIILQSYATVISLTLDGKRKTFANVRQIAKLGISIF